MAQLPTTKAIIRARTIRSLHFTLGYESPRRFERLINSPSLPSCSSLRRPTCFDIYSSPSRVTRTCPTNSWPKRRPWQYRQSRALALVEGETCELRSCSNEGELSDRIRHDKSAYHGRRQRLSWRTAQRLTIQVLLTD